MTYSVSEPVKIKRQDSCLHAPEYMRHIDIAVVVPVKDNQIGVERFLKSFKEHTPKHAYPRVIIFVDNHSKPPLGLTEDNIEVTELRLAQCTKPGAAAARNVGAAIAMDEYRAEWLLFMDSDCQFDETTLVCLPELINGAIGYQLTIQANSDDWLSQFYDTQQILMPPVIQEEGESFYRPDTLVTAGALVWSNAFREVGGFSETFPSAAGEDTLLGYRLRMIGQLSYHTQSIVRHDFIAAQRQPTYRDVMDLIKRFYRYGVGNRLLETVLKEQCDIQVNKEPNRDKQMAEERFSVVCETVSRPCQLEEVIVEALFSEDELILLSNTAMMYGYHDQALPMQDPHKQSYASLASKESTEQSSEDSMALRLG